MNIFRVNALVGRAADTLAELAHELRQVADGARDAGAEQWGPWERRLQARGAGEPDSQRVYGIRDGADGPASVDLVGRLRAFWDGVWMAPVMVLGAARIDLATAQGRWELLVLAVLLGARVSESVVEQTFTRLRDEELLDPFRLAESPEGAQAELRSIFDAHYRALGNKYGKADALIFNAKLLVDRWQGDLDTLYVEAKEAACLADRDELRTPVDEEMLIRSLQSFRHIKQLAFWVCRTLKAHGIWRDLSDWATAYHDRYTRLPLERLGLLKVGTSELPTAGVMPLYLQGLNLCAQDDAKTCLAECPVAAWCAYPQSGRKHE